MKIRYQRKSVTNPKRGTTSFSVSPSQLEDLRYLSKWLLVIPAVMFLLFCFGQLGILASRKLAERSAYLPVGVDYGPWAYVLIHSSRSGYVPPEEHEDDSSIVVVSPQATAVVLGIPTATDNPSPPSATPSSDLKRTPLPKVTPAVLPEYTSTPTVESSRLPTDTPTQFSPTPSNSESYKVCDADGHPLSYDDLHLHTANVKDNGFGTIIHALRVDAGETLVILEKLTVKQNQENPQTLEVVSVDWSHWGMGGTKIDVLKAQDEVTITTNLEFYTCFTQGKCDHSLYGGEVYIDFDGELSGEYRLFVGVSFPEYDEKCTLDLVVIVKP